MNNQVIYLYSTVKAHTNMYSSCVYKIYNYIIAYSLRLGLTAINY